jgi:iron complex transport system substrate-binding protein
MLESHRLPNHLPRLIVIAALFFASMIFSNMVLAAGWPVTVTDDLGREVQLQQPPERIVSLLASHTEAVAALGALELLVAVDDYSDWPAGAAALPTVGNGYQPNIEAIVQLQPDLVLVDQFSGVEQALAGLGMTVYAGSPQSYGEIFAFNEQLGLLLGRSGQAGQLNAQLQADIHELQLLSSGEPPVSVFVELDPTPFSAGPGSYIGTLLELLGGVNILPASLGDWPQVEPEFVISADPQMILLLDAPFGETAADVAARPGWAALQAVTGGRVEELPEDQVNALSRPGPRVAYAAAVLAQRLHPEAFPAGSFDPSAFEPQVALPAVR